MENNPLMVPLKKVSTTSSVIKSALLWEPFKIGKYALQ
jgi:hypothetical protein